MKRQQQTNQGWWKVKKEFLAGSEEVAMISFEAVSKLWYRLVISLANVRHCTTTKMFTTVVEKKTMNSSRSSENIAPIKYVEKYWATLHKVVTNQHQQK